MVQMCGLSTALAIIFENMPHLVIIFLVINYSFVTLFVFVLYMLRRRSFNDIYRFNCVGREAVSLLKPESQLL